jgi:acid phosphatase class B
MAHKYLRDEDFENKKAKQKKQIETEWIEIGFNEVIFKIPKEYNHQLVIQHQKVIDDLKFLYSIACGFRTTFEQEQKLKKIVETYQLNNEVPSSSHA